MQERFINIFIKTTPYLQNSRSFIQDNRKTIILALMVFFSALLFRSWQNVLNPGLYWEDAIHFFNIYYGINRDLSFILQNHNGYYNILTNLVAWLAQHLDVRIQPLIYLLFALFLGVITAIAFLFTGLIRTRFILIVTPLVLGLSGMNHIFYFNTLTFQMYNAVVLLLCLLFLPIPRSQLALLVWCVIITILVWSGPYSVVALPAAVMLLVFFQNREKTVLLVSVILNILLYIFTVRDGTIMLSNIADKGVLSIANHVLFERVFFLELLGEMSFIKVCLFLLLLASIVYYLRKNVFYMKVSITFFIIIIGAFAPFFLSIKFLLYQQVFPCHIYISQFFWICFILFTVDQIFQKAQPRLGIKLIITAMFFLLVLFDNIQHPDKGRIELMPLIPDFVQTIHLIEQLELENTNQFVEVKTDNIIPGFMAPMVRVGSQRHDAQRLGSKDIPIDAGKQFIVE